MKIEELDEDGRCVEVTARKRKLVVTDTKRALVGAGARILFYPTLLYNVFRNKIQAEFRWWDEIDQFILLGAVPFPKDVPRLKQLGVGGVITLNEAYETLVPTSAYLSHGIDHLVIPTRDYLFAPSFEDITKAVDFIHKNAIRRRTTYVHCKAGRGRSTTIVLCYLVEHKRMTPRAALDYVRSRRPRVLLAPSQWKAVQEYKKLQSVLLKPAALTPGSCNNPESGAESSVTSSPASSLSGDVVFITKADLEGYRSGDERDERNELVLEPRVVARHRLVMARLSCLFASLGATDGCTAMGQRLTQTQAC